MQRYRLLNFTMLSAYFKIFSNHYILNRFEVSSQKSAHLSIYNQFQFIILKELLRQIFHRRISRGGRVNGIAVCADFVTEFLCNRSTADHDEYFLSNS